MEYLYETLGIKTIYDNNRTLELPYYLNSKYQTQLAAINGVDVVFVRPKEILDSIFTVKTHLSKISSIANARVILLFDSLTSRQKTYLIREHIPFIVDGKQIYLPFMAMYLQEKNDAERVIRKDILPSAQLLLLYFIYQGCHDLYTAKAAKDLNFTPTSISRAVKQLEEMGLIKTRINGVNKIIYSNKKPNKLFSEAKQYLVNPVKRTVYLPKTAINNDCLLGGYSALSNYSMLNASLIDYYCTSNASLLEKNGTMSLINPNEQCAAELWRYDPNKLSNNGIVDRLSLALSLQDVKDERVVEAVDEMLNDAWKEIENGQRY